MFTLVCLPLIRSSWKCVNNRIVDFCGEEKQKTWRREKSARDKGEISGRERDQETESPIQMADPGQNAANASSRFVNRKLEMYLWIFYVIDPISAWKMEIGIWHVTLMPAQYTLDIATTSWQKSHNIRFWSQYVCDIYSVSRLLVDLGWVDFGLGVPPCCPAAQPLLPKSHHSDQPRQNGTPKIQVNPTQSTTSRWDTILYL